MRNFWKHKNRGFTLVELIVTIAIMTIVGGAITSFLVVSQRQYNNGVAETGVQYDAQLVGNQIYDLLIDAQRGVSYGYVGELADGTPDSGLIMDNSSLGDYHSLELYVYNTDKYYRMRWDKAEKKVFFAEAAPGVVINDSMEALLAEFVTDFSVDLSELLTKKTITYSITFLKEESGREYSIKRSVKLRNDILVNATEDELYVPEAPEVEATGIDVYPSSVSIWPGESYKLASRVTSNVGLMPNQAVEWFIAAHPSGESAVTDLSGTYFADSTLFIGNAEEGRVIDGEPHRINVYAKQASTGLVSENVKVGVRTITGLEGRVYLEGFDNTFATDTITVTAGQKDICVELNTFKGFYIDDLLTGDMEENIKNMGGITISVDSKLEMVPSMEEALRTGRLLLNAKSGIDFGTESSVTATVTIKSAREPYTGVSETITIVIKATDMEDPIDVSGGWKRNGLLQIDLSKVGGAIGEGYALNVHIQFCRENESGEPEAYGPVYTYGDQGRYGETNAEYPEYRYQPQEGNPFEILFSATNYNDVQLYLKAENTSYSERYYDPYGEYYTICGARIWLTYGNYNSLDYVPDGYYVAIDPVAFKYSMDGINQSVWDTKGATTIYAAPVSENNNYAMNNGYYDGALDSGLENYKTYKVYYRLYGGWFESLIKKEDRFALDDERFVCLIDGVAGYTVPKGAYNVAYRIFSKNAYASTYERGGNGYGYIDVTSGMDDYGYYIEVSIPDSLNQYYAEKGSTMNVVYEGNWAAGMSTELDVFRLMEGCEYGFKVKFVEDNLNEEYGVYELVREGWLWWQEKWEYKSYTLSSLPSTQYCPPQSELKTLGYGNESYFYITPQERYLIRTVTTGTVETYYITYEKYVTSTTGSGRWVSQWKDNDKYTIWYSYNTVDKEWQYSSMKF